MENLQELYKKLQESSDLNYNNKCEDFVDTIDKILSYNDPSSIPLLLKCFKDEHPTYPMEVLMITLENYKPEDYIKHLLDNMEEILPHGKFWLQGLLYGILNNSTYLEIFKKNLHRGSKGALLDVLSIMEQESPHHRELIAELRQELEKSNS